ncbi:MAG: hypothetical protein PVF83_15110 [Anaerolineales bacterium]|jgi:hypothetical protein
MSEENKHINNIRKIQAKVRFLLQNKKSIRGLISTITKRIRKTQWPRIQQQFYIDPGVDWE